MQEYFNTILPIVHKICKEQSHMHINSPDCKCNPERSIGGGYDKKTKEKVPFYVSYVHHYLWEPRKVEYPFPIGVTQPRKRSKGEDFFDDQDTALKIQDSYSTITNTSISNKFKTAIGMGLRYE